MQSRALGTRRWRTTARWVAVAWLFAAIAAPWLSVQAHARTWEALFLSGICVSDADARPKSGAPDTRGDAAGHHHAGQCCLPAARGDLVPPALVADAVPLPALSTAPAVPLGWQEAQDPWRPLPGRAPQSPRGPPGHV